MSTILKYTCFSIASLMNGSEGEEVEKMEIDASVDNNNSGNGAIIADSPEDGDCNRQALEHLLLFGRELAAQSSLLSNAHEELKSQVLRCPLICCLHVLLVCIACTCYLSVLLVYVACICCLHVLLVCVVCICCYLFVCVLGPRVKF